MNKLILLGALFFASLSSYAQVNPHEGYLITNSNDTIFGTIDYLSDEKCANECLFKATNDLDFKAYKPNEIKGYRFFRDGVFYVSKNFPVDGVEKTFFAEFLIKGGISLYHYRSSGTDYYFFEDQDGKVAQMKSLEFRYDSPEEQRNAIRENLRDVSQILKKDPNTVYQMNKDPRVSEKKLVGMVKRYDEKFCSADGDCIQYEYETKASESSNFRLLVEAGVEFSSLTLKSIEAVKSSYYPDIEMDSYVVPVIGLGTRVNFPRFSRHLYMDALLRFSKGETSCDKKIKYFHRKMKASYTNAEVKLNLGYSFMPDSKFSPIVHGGVLVSDALKYNIENGFGYALDDATSNCLGTAMFLGLGARYKIGKHNLMLSVEYFRRNLSSNPVKGFATNLKFVL